MKTPLFVLSSFLLFAGQQASEQRPSPKKEFVDTDVLFKGIGSIRVDVETLGTTDEFYPQPQIKLDVEKVLASRKLLGGPNAPGRLLIKIGSTLDTSTKAIYLFYYSVRFTRTGTFMPENLVDATATIWEDNDYGTVGRSLLRGAISDGVMDGLKSFLEEHAGANAGYKGSLLPDDACKPVSSELSVKGIKQVRVEVDADEEARQIYSVRDLTVAVGDALAAEGVKVDPNAPHKFVVSVSGMNEDAKLVWLAEVELVQVGMYEPPASAGSVVYFSRGITWKSFVVNSTPVASLQPARAAIVQLVRNFARLAQAK
jgi:hypothetical protein